MCGCCDFIVMSFRLLVNLTQPALLCFKDVKERKDSEFTKSYMEVIGYLQSYKEVCRHITYIIIHSAIEHVMLGDNTLFIVGEYF